MSDQVDEFRILTCADSNFYRFLPSLERNIFRRFGRYPVVYDLGLTERQIKSLKSDVLRVSFDESFRDVTPSGYIRTTHKPDCIAHYLSKHSENCLYVDADVFFVDFIDETVFEGADVAVTPRHPRELQAEDPFKNGKINAGVLYFRNTARVRDFVEVWGEACRVHDHSDQLAMSNLLETTGLEDGFGTVPMDGMNIRKLDPLIYNDTGCSQGKIWHFKNAGRRFHKLRRRTWVGFLDDISPRLFQRYAGRGSG